MTLSWQDCRKDSGGSGRGFYPWLLASSAGSPLRARQAPAEPWASISGVPGPLTVPCWRRWESRESQASPDGTVLWAGPSSIPSPGVSLKGGEKVKFPHASRFIRSQFSSPQSGFTGRNPSTGRGVKSCRPALLPVWRCRD